MASARLLCRKCKKLLEAEELKDTGKCPNCGSTDFGELRSFTVPEADGGGPPPWDFVCEKCGVYFQVPVPRGPDEAGLIACPLCGSQDITRHNACTLDSYQHACG